MQGYGLLFISSKPCFPLHPCPKFFPFKVVCDHQDLFRESQEEHQSQLQFCAGTAFFSHISHLVRPVPHYTFLLVHYSLQLKSSWISDEVCWAQGEIEHRVNKPCSDLHSLSWILVIIFFPKKHCVGKEKHLHKMCMQLWDNLFLVNGKF